MNMHTVHKVGKSVVSWLSLDDSAATYDEIYTSWCNANFIFKEEDSRNEIAGLRPPQVGGIFAVLGYTRSDDKGAATVVMPTGTGKTETILSIVVAGKFQRTLVVVPSDALREQTTNKFLEFGLLRQLGLIDESVKNPVVSTINGGVGDDEELQRLLESNVIVASVPALAKFSNQSLAKLTEQCTHLIVDEAHHITAATWARVKALFDGKPVFQFTATPFRADCSRVEGKIIFNYPLKKAQEDGYFKPINFHPVSEFVDELADKAIADKAIELLKEDLEGGLDHILMARASTIGRAKEIFELYSHEKELNPILIYSKVQKKLDVLQAIKDRKHKIIVCVNMLGEGFDLPQLKISAIHDPHKSINVMLQFTGRFTRKADHVGDAKFVANIANPSVNDSLEELYKEDSDWNSLISDISTRKIKDEKEYQEFREGFSEPSKLLDLGLNPSISTIVYRMKLATWTPDKFTEFGNKQFHLVDSILDDEKTMLIFSVKSYSLVGWTTSKELFDESWDLYIAYYDHDKDLLFIHSSAKDGLVKKLVKLIANKAVQVKGDYVFRSLAGLKRLKLQNVGLNKTKKGLRFSMHTGPEINEHIPEIEARRATKSNIFGKGYENGQLVSIGCSYKGKVWSMDSDSIDKWVAWCKGVGTKILDDSIDTNEVMKTAMQTEELLQFPEIHPLSVEWPVELLRKNESKIIIRAAAWAENFINCELVVSEVRDADVRTMNIDLVTPSGKHLIKAHIHHPGEMSFSTPDDLVIEIGDNSLPLSGYFNENPPTIFLADTSVIDGGLRYYCSEGYAYRYEKDYLEDWDWTGVDISVESQTDRKKSDSIQYHAIQRLLHDYDVIFDDDGSGEIADIVAIKNHEDRELAIDLFHCKYCTKKNGVATPGARIDDVYQVAGQAEKCVKWFTDIEKLIARLMERERNRLSNGKATRIDKGNYKDLQHLAKVARFAEIKLGVSIVQPAISKAQVSDDQLAVFGATAAYIDEVSGVKLRVIINK